MNKTNEGACARPLLNREPMIDDPVIWSPLMDFYELDNKYVLNAEIPGVERKDVKVELKDSELMIRGERKIDAVCAKESYHRLEGRRGKFFRIFPLPEPVDGSRIHITLDNGVLNVTIPKIRSEKNQSNRDNH
jgi:HSP20 family protein